MPRPPEDPAEIAARAARSSARASWAQVLIAFVTLVVGGAAGFAVGRNTTSTRTVTTTVPTKAVVGSGDSTSTRTAQPMVPCAPRPGAPGPSNATVGTAGGPLVANQPIRGAIRAQGSKQYVSLCLTQAAEVTFSMDCLGGQCDELYAEFPAAADVTSDFNPRRPLTCDISVRGRYIVVVETNAVPVSYVLTVHSNDASALSPSLPASLAPPEPNQVKC